MVGLSGACAESIRSIARKTHSKTPTCLPSRQRRTLRLQFYQYTDTSQSVENSQRYLQTIRCILSRLSTLYVLSFSLPTIDTKTRASKQPFRLLLLLCGKGAAPRCLPAASFFLFPSHVKLMSSRIMSSSSFLTNRPLTRSRLSAKFLRTSYLTVLVHTRWLRFSRKRSMRTLRLSGE